MTTREGLPNVDRCVRIDGFTFARLELAASYEGWYRYGDSNPGPVAENHVS